MENIEKIIPGSNPYIVGVVSDTHIPDRVVELNPYLLDQLRSQNVQLILHAGDIAVQSVLKTLETVAPVRAVTGNRDIFLSGILPMSLHLEIFGSKITLTHGHLGIKNYWLDKFAHVTKGYVFERYQKRLERSFPESRVIVFGHTHHIENRWIGEKLYFNPGSVSHGDKLIPNPYFGLLKFYDDGRIEACLVPLTGAAIRNKKWELIR
jgi:putative phosphoesterase